jgi:Type II CAAX prenyl endopeptidase Rce1-like
MHVLVFLLPFIIFYELGTRYFLTDARQGSVEAIVAHSLIVGFFQQFGAVGRHFPAIAIIAVLLSWHTIRKDRWRVQPRVLIAMAMESVIWAVPLVVILMVVQSLGAGPFARALELASASERGGQELSARPWQFRLTISIGAGLYEEWLFRFIGLAALHFVLVDLIRLSEGTGRLLSVMLSALAFTFYHDVSPSDKVQLVRALVYFSAGLYFGALYYWRGFGIVVAVHALYDVIVLIGLEQGP